ncbi:HalOD1 output domain-containing protein [Halorubrum sp. Ea8]|uniref:HalOD1 output domain-containing protein n=1 Tax=Halorubrum sp. Ea8 TaxID=1383841 RepID=UPI000B9846F3|nr:HalOD1 output domain-containing protein [Halorubrum sp. Ea8]OYR52914.1 hypothetical protein DJ74_00285 [Halorubrum sp. Ea8]
MYNDLISDVIKAIAHSKDMEPEELDIVLQDHIDPDALETLVKHDKGTWSLQFALPEQTVMVESNGQILVNGQFEQCWGSD